MNFITVKTISGYPVLINLEQVCWIEEVASPLNTKKKCCNVFTSESDASLAVDATLDEICKMIDPV